MQHGSKQLRAWLVRSKLDQRQGAQVLGLHWTTVNKILIGSRLPGRQVAIDLEAKTGIPVAAWATTVGKSKKTVRRISKNTNIGRVSTDVSIT